MRFNATVTKMNGHLSETRLRRKKRAYSGLLATPGPGGL
jgi:hypothetical protein